MHTDCEDVLKIQTYTCSGVIDSPYGELPFSIDINGIVTVQVASFDSALKWLQGVDGATPPMKVTSTPDGDQVAVPKWVVPSEEKAKRVAAFVRETVQAAESVTTPVEPVVLVSETPAPTPALLALMQGNLHTAATLAPEPSPEPEPEPAPSAPPEAKASEEAEAPRRRGRPKGSKNKKTEAGSDPTPEADPEPAVAPAATKPAIPTPPQSAPAKPAPAVSAEAPDKMTILVGTTGWGVEVTPTVTGYQAQCTQLKQLIGTGDDKTEAVKDLRQVIANYMREHLSSEVNVDPEGPIETVKEPKKAEKKAEAPAPAPAPSAEAAITPAIAAAESPAMAVYLYVKDRVKESPAISVDTLIEKLYADWTRIPALREKTKMAKEKLTTLVTAHRDQAIREIEKALDDKDDAA